MTRPRYALLLGALVALAEAASAQLSVPTRLTKVVDAYPMLSPDGSTLVFESNRSGNTELYTIRADGSGLKRLTDTPHDEGTPVWSPDGRRILFAAEIPDGGEEVFVMNADGSGVERLTTHPGSDGHAHWSPDGKRIILNSARTTPDLGAPWSRQWHEIFTMNADGTDLRQITHCRSICTYGVFSPDGNKIAYRKVTNDPGFNWDLTMGARNSEVFVANADGSDERNISRSAGYDGWPMWAPDGKRVLFSSNRGGKPSVGELFVASPDGTGLQRLSASVESLVQPTWSPDGRKIYAAQYTLDEEAASIVILDVPALATP